GIHYVGQMQEGSITRFMVDQLTEGQLEWARLPSAYDAVILGEPGAGTTYRIHAGKEEYFRGLKERFPGEGAAIDEFRRLVESIRRGCVMMGFLKMAPRPLGTLLCRSGLLPWLSPFCRLAARSLEEVVAGITANRELRAVLSYIFPTYGRWPRGAGAARKAPVQRILLDSQGKACGECQHGTGHTGLLPVAALLLTGAVPAPSPLSLPGVSVKKGQDLVNIFAPVIISDAGIFNTYERLLPPEARELPEIQSQLRMMTHGEGGFTVFVGLNGSSEELGLEPTNYFMYSGSDLDEIMSRYLASSREEAAKNIPVLFVACPSAKDPTWEMRHPGKSTMAIVTFAKYEWFEEWKDEQVKKRGDDYEELKQTFVDTIMQAVFKLYPRIQDRVKKL
ncbi:RETST reductase, partial [Corythaeola cristata]|nr:RETST reductase [Corythaeola cristata]